MAESPRACSSALLDNRGGAVMVALSRICRTTTGTFSVGAGAGHFVWFEERVRAVVIANPAIHSGIAR